MRKFQPLVVAFTEVGVVIAGEVWFCVRFEVLGEVVLSEGEVSVG